MKKYAKILIIIHKKMKKSEKIVANSRARMYNYSNLMNNYACVYQMNCPLHLQFGNQNAVWSVLEVK